MHSYNIYSDSAHKIASELIETLELPDSRLEKVCNSITFTVNKERMGSEEARDKKNVW